MPAVVSCRCGQRFQAPDRLLGKTLPCPACGQPLAIPAAKSQSTTGPAPAATPAPVPAESGLVVSCACGRSFRASQSLRGRTARCPACGGPISIPPAESAEVDLFGIDPLMNSDPLAAAMAMPIANSLVGHAANP